MSAHVIGVYRYLDDLKEATRRLKSAGYEDIEVFSPIPLHGIEEILGPKKSILRRISLGGAIAGGIGGFLMAALCALVFVLPTGGRPVVPWPPFLLITYETTILVGTLATLVGFFISANLPAWKDRPYVPAMSNDRFGVHVGCGVDEVDDAEAIMRDYGAETVERI